jgi:hypothetical protein
LPRSFVAPPRTTLRPFASGLLRLLLRAAVGLRHALILSRRSQCRRRDRHHIMKLGDCVGFLP